jgi:predicted secreted protein
MVKYRHETSLKGIALKKGILFALVILLVSCLSCTSARRQTEGEKEPQGIGPAAVWDPDNSFRERVVDRCSSPKIQDFGECFVSVMTDSKASPQALAFARRIGNTGYLRGFRKTGAVDIAYVAYPFRANENYGCLLVNGDPSVVDVDDLGIIEKIDLTADKQYEEIAFGFPRVELWPGDRWEADCAIPGSTRDGRQRFLVMYRLLNGCHACELLGSARVAFDFDSAGKFRGTELLGIEGAVRVVSDPEKPVKVTVGRKFFIVLQSNRTTGYRWEISSAGNAAVVKSVGAEYTPPDTKLVGAGGKEIWTFEAVGKGITEISLKYVRPWEKDVPPAKSVTFKLNVE